MILVFISCSALGPGEKDGQTNDSPRVNYSNEIVLKTHFSESAIVFDVLDCVSNWWDGYCWEQEAYTEDFKNRFELTNSDQIFFKEYDLIRRKYYNSKKGNGGLFSTLESQNADPIALAFYRGTNSAEALDTISGMVTTEELRFLKRFYSNFESRTAVYLAESKAFRGSVDTLSEAISGQKIHDYVERIKSFYGVATSIEYSATFSWWPPLDYDNASPTGNVLVLRKNPNKHLSWSDVDIFFHELVHVVSARQDERRKLILTEKFLETCELPGSVKGGKRMEEPLAVAVGQMYFLEKFDPQKFQDTVNWYRDPWIHEYSQKIYPLVKRYLDEHRLMDVEFMQSAAKYCSEVSL